MRLRLPSLLTVAVLVLATPAGAHARPAAGGIDLALESGQVDVPVRVPIPASDDDTLPEIYVGITSNGDVDDATYTTSVDGLTVANPTGPVPAVDPDDPASLDLTGLRGVTPGLHALTLTVSGPDVRTSSITFPFLWVPGDQAVTATDSLRGRVYERSYDATGDDCTDCRVERTSVYWFVDAHHVAVGRSDHGVPSCARASAHSSTECLPYRYDATTGLVQIGDDELGRLTDHEAVFVSASFVDPHQAQGDQVTYRRLVPLRTHRLSRTWTYHGPPRAPYLVQLTLRRDGTYRLRDNRGTPGAPWRDITGRYRIGADRALHLLTQRRTTRAHRPWPRTLTLLDLAYNSGHPEGTVALWLGLPRRSPDPHEALDDSGGYLVTAKL